MWGAGDERAEPPIPTRRGGPTEVEVQLPSPAFLPRHINPQKLLEMCRSVIGDQVPKCTLRVTGEKLKMISLPAQSSRMAVQTMLSPLRPTLRKHLGQRHRDLVTSSSRPQGNQLGRIKPKRIAISVPRGTLEASELGLPQASIWRPVVVSSPAKERSDCAADHIFSSVRWLASVDMSSPLNIRITIQLNGQRDWEVGPGGGEVVISRRIGRYCERRH